MFIEHLKQYPLEVIIETHGFESDIELFATIMKNVPPAQNLDLRKKVNILAKIQTYIINYLPYQRSLK